MIFYTAAMLATKLSCFDLFVTRVNFISTMKWTMKKAAIVIGYGSITD